MEHVKPSHHPNPNFNKQGEEVSLVPYIPITHTVNLSQPNYEKQSNILAREKIDNTRGNILKAYQPKVDEFNVYCKKIYNGELEPLLITPDKVYGFLYYQPYRTKKKRSKKEKAVLLRKEKC